MYQNGAAQKPALRYSSIAQSVEHLTVNQGVTGSSPVGGATRKEDCESGLLFLLVSRKTELDENQVRH